MKLHLNRGQNLLTIVIGRPSRLVQSKRVLPELWGNNIALDPRQTFLTPQDVRRRTQVAEEPHLLEATDCFDVYSAQLKRYRPTATLRLLVVGARTHMGTMFAQGVSLGPEEGCLAS
jgi:hypothetical protein